MMAQVACPAGVCDCRLCGSALPSCFPTIVTVVYVLFRPDFLVQVTAPSVPTVTAFCSRW